MKIPSAPGNRREGARPVVAQVHRGFFYRTETFIYNVVTRLHRYHPIFISKEYLNLDAFPIPTTDCFSLARTSWTWDWLRQGFGHRLLGRELLAEEFIRAHDTRLLHAHFGRDGIWALSMKRALGLPMVVTFYGHDLSKAGTLESSREDYPRLFGEANLFLVEGPHMKEVLTSIGCPGEKIVIQRIAIPLDKLLFRTRLPKGRGDSVVFVFSGRFVEKKGLLQALQAFRTLKTHRAHEFRIIGDGPLRSAIEDFIRVNNIGARVRMLGFLDYPSYLEQMSEADIFLHPSMTAADGDSEGGAPTTILEAQALGLPVVSTRHADIPYVVVPGESALLSAEGDVAELAANMQRLVEDQESWASMGIVGRRHVETHHDIAIETQRLEKLYDELGGPHEA